MSTGRDPDADRAATMQVLAGRRPPSAGATNWLGHRTGSGAERMDALLLAGATREQLAATRGAVENHLRHLADEHGLTVTRDGGVYRFSSVATSPPVPPSLPAPPTPPVVHPGHPVEVRGAITTYAGDPRGRLQRTKLWLEIVSVTVAILGGLVALIYRFFG